MRASCPLHAKYRFVLRELARRSGCWIGIRSLRCKRSRAAELLRPVTRPRGPTLPVATEAQTFTGRTVAQLWQPGATGLPRSPPTPLQRRRALVTARAGAGEARAGSPPLPLPALLPCLPGHSSFLQPAVPAGIMHQLAPMLRARPAEWRPHRGAQQTLLRLMAQHPKMRHPLRRHTALPDGLQQDIQMPTTTSSGRDIMRNSESGHPRDLDTTVDVGRHVDLNDFAFALPIRARPGRRGLFCAAFAIMDGSVVENPKINASGKEGHPEVSVRSTAGPGPIQVIWAAALSASLHPVKRH